MTQVGIEALASQLREYLRLARTGEKVLVTDEGRPVAILSGIGEGQELSQIWDLVHAGEANWSGGKPKGSARPVKIRGKSLSEMVLEDRR